MSKAPLAESELSALTHMSGVLVITEQVILKSES